jgi:hypothetical protein
MKIGTSLYAMSSQVVTPERFNPGSSPNYLWIPAKDMRK